MTAAKTTQTPTDEEVCDLVQGVVDSSIRMYEAVNSPRGAKGAITAQDRAVKRLLTVILGRKPTGEEIARVAGE